MDDLIRTLIDERDIHRLLVRYADRVDANDPVGAAACFTPAGTGIYWGEFCGREAIAARLAEILDGFTVTSHHLSNAAIDVTGDEAISLSYVYAFHRRVSDDSPLHVWARWVDRLERTDEGWRFARREVARVGRISLEAEERIGFEGHPGRLDRASGD